MKSAKKKIFNIFEVAGILLITAIFSALTTGVILSNKSYANLTDEPEVGEFLGVYASILNDYYESVDKSALINSAISGMFNYLGDDYSTYMSKQMTEDLTNKLAGEYEGVGIQISDGNIVAAVFDNSPAFEAGILKDDKIIKINSTDVTSKTTTEVVNLIKADKTKPISITIIRGEEELTVSVTIKKVALPTVTHKLIEQSDKKIGYIYIESFAANTASQMKTALEKLEKENIDSLIVDVRNNSGGYLAVAKEITNMFLEKGKVIYSLEEQTKVEITKDTTDEKRDYEIVVLINKASASASEILAAALKDSYGATLVGETSFGKGKVQQTKNLTGGSMVKYTTAKWLTPNNICIDGTGIKPDIEIVLDSSLVPKSKEGQEGYETEVKAYTEHILKISEEQYNKAIEILTK